MTSCLVAVLLALAPGEGPRDAGASAAPERNEVAVGVASLGYSSFFRATGGILTGTLTYHRGWGAGAPDRLPPLRLGAGLRFGQPPTSPIDTPRFPLELFVTVQLQARVRLGPVLWEPAVGPELGMSGLADLGWGRATLPEDLYVLEQRRSGPFYLGFTAEVLRFRVWRITASTLALTIATGLTPPGATTRTDLSYLRLGVML